MLTTVATILSVLQAAQQAATLYTEVKSTLSADDQASIDAELAKLGPQEIADEDKAEIDLSAAAKN